MKRQTILILASASLILGSLTSFAESDSEAFSGLSLPSAITSAPLILPTWLLIGSAASSEDSKNDDRKVLLERVANDALANIDTGETSEILKLTIESLKKENTSLQNRTDREISVALLKELISGRGN